MSIFPHVGFSFTISMGLPWPCCSLTRSPDKWAIGCRYKTRHQHTWSIAIHMHNIFWWKGASLLRYIELPSICTCTAWMGLCIYRCVSLRLCMHVHGANSHAFIMCHFSHNGMTNCTLEVTWTVPCQMPCVIWPLHPHSGLERSLCTGCNISSYFLSYRHIWCGFGVSVYIYIHVQLLCQIMMRSLISGPKSLEAFKEWSWACFSGILVGVHHYYIMQPVALVSDDVIIRWNRKCTVIMGCG